VRVAPHEPHRARRGRTPHRDPSEPFDQIVRAYLPAQAYWRYPAPGGVVPGQGGGYPAARDTHGASGPAQRGARHRIGRLARLAPVIRAGKSRDGSYIGAPPADAADGASQDVPQARFGVCRQLRGRAAGEKPDRWRPEAKTARNAQADPGWDGAVISDLQTGVPAVMRHGEERSSPGIATHGYRIMSQDQGALRC
jgi:hypothetical protein